jgi:hypothetical protein
MRLLTSYILGVSQKCPHRDDHLLWDFFERAPYIYWVNRIVLISSPYNCQRGRL